MFFFYSVKTINYEWTKLNYFRVYTWIPSEESTGMTQKPDTQGFHTNALSSDLESLKSTKALSRDPEVGQATPSQGHLCSPHPSPARTESFG